MRMMIATSRLGWRKFTGALEDTLVASWLGCLSTARSLMTRLPAELFAKDEDSGE